MDEALAIRATQRWVDTVVVDLSLCPFVKRELAKDSVRLTATVASSEEALLEALRDELELLTNDTAIETTLLIHPHVLQEFSAYNQFLDVADELLIQMNLTGIYQVASFHPHYQFASTEPDDVENYTNRSPYPVLHLLREASLERAIDGYPDTGLIPERNIARMKALGVEKLVTLLQDCK